jgi:HSP20 family protein
MFGVTKRSVDPMLDLLYRLEQRMGRVFTEPFRTIDWQTIEPSTAWVPPVDIVEEPEQIRIVAEIPGVKPEDVKLSVVGNLLTISGTKVQVAEEKAEKVHRYERDFGAFERTFTLPASVDVKQIKATYDGGLLHVTLHKTDAAKPQLVPIQDTPAPKALK